MKKIKIMNNKYINNLKILIGVCGRSGWYNAIDYKR